MTSVADAASTPTVGSSALLEARAVAVRMTFRTAHWLAIPAVT